MPAYLSDEWFAAAAAVLGEDPVDGAVTVEQRAGDLVWHAQIAGTEVRLRPGPAVAPDVTFTQTYEVAAAVARGERSAQAAVMAGEITVDGNVSVLLTAAPALADLEDRLADLRAETRY
jgi:hypothetical protein